MSRNFETEYSLNDKRYIPHVTIYQACYPRPNYELLRHKVPTIAKITPSLQLRFREYRVHAGTYVWWTAEDSEALLQLHWRVLNSLNPLREGLVLPHIEPNGLAYTTGEELTTEESANVRTYGAVAVAGQFRSHVTLGACRCNGKRNRESHRLRSLNEGGQPRRQLRPEGWRSIWPRPHVHVAGVMPAWGRGRRGRA